MARLEISLLGAFQVTLDGEHAQFKTDKTRALLAYLTLEADQPHRRTSLAGLLWPDHPETRARHNLRQTLLYLRKAIGDEFLLVTRSTLQFDAESDHLLDVARFTALIERSTTHDHADADASRCRACIRRLEEAVELYTSEFLAQFFLDDSDAFEEWAQVTRESLRRKALSALTSLTRYYTARGEYQSAQRYARRQIAINPLREDAYRQVMRALVAQGRRNEALAQYEQLRELLAEELGVEPSTETISLYEKLSSDTWERSSEGAVPAVSPLLPGSAAPLHNLPRQFSKFVGRKAELDDIAEMLAVPNCGLVTLVGPGGVGKTRLAVQAAHDQRASFRDGVWFVALAPIASSELLLPAVADVLGVSFDSRLQTDAARKEQLLQFLQARELLLILDNVEHLLPAPDLIIDILHAAPEVKLLITSREPLNLRAEWVLDIDGLPVPPPSGDPANVNATGYEAVQLFEQTARRVQRNFTLDEERALAVAHICRLVAGLPLAIELAAVLLRDTEPQQLSQEIDASLDVLATTMRDVPARHRSLRAVFSHSWDLLSEAEQTVFARLSVFRGGFTRDAAVEIADTSPEILTGLTQKSLLRHVDDDRYEMHEVLRQYAAEQLAPEDDAAHDRHCYYYTTFVRQCAKTSAATYLLDGLNAIRSEIDNVRAAWRWAIAQPAIEALERSHAALASYYDHRYLFDEGETAFRRAVTAVRSHAATEYGDARSRRTLAALLAEQARFLARQARYEPAIRTAQEAIAIAVDVNDLRTEAAGHLQWGRALENQGLYKEAQTHYEQVLSRASSVSIPLLEAESLLGLGGVSQKQTDYVGSEPYYERALALFQEIGDRQWEAFALHNLGHIYRVPGDYDTARRYYEEAMELYRTIDDRAGKGMVLSSLGAMLSEQGRFAEARTYTEQYLVRMREVGDRREEGVALVNLGLDSLCLGNFEMAGAYLRQSLELRRHIGDRQGEGWSLMALGFLANQAGAHDDAVDYCRQALDYAEALGDLQVEAHALTHLGHALTALGQLEDAGEAYSHARRLYRELGWTNSAMEPQAGLAHVALLQDDVNGAETYIEDVVSHMEVDFLDGTFDPVGICLTCYRVLDAGGDVRARVVLDAAYEYLQEQANKISDDALQRSFLENVPAHRQLTAIYRRAEVEG